MSREVDLGQIVPNIQVGTITTGLPSTPASVENVGTDLNPIFDFTIPKGDTGATPNIQIGDVQTGDSSEVTRTGTDENPILNFTLEKGDTGNGIASIAKTSTSGLVDTYTITFTNGQTTTFEVTNGANGDVVDVQVDGTSVVDNGIANIVGLAEMKQELEDMYNLLPKVSGTGETITLDGTVAGKMLIDLKGNTSQEGTPTPESPQDIHVVSGDNSIEVCGKNLARETFDTKFVLTGSGNNRTVVSVDYNSAEIVAVKPNTNYVISGDFSSLADNIIRIGMFDNFPKVDDTSTKYIYGASGLTFTTDTNTKYIMLMNGRTVNTTVDNLFVCETQYAATYEPHQEQTYLINLGDIELCKIGDYQDSIVKDNGKWYLNKQIGKAVLNGSETITSNPNGTNSYFIDVYGVNKISSVINTICNYFRGINYNDRAVRGDNVIYGEINQNKITIRNTTYTSIELFTTFLSTYKPIVYYVLATPTYTEITDSTLISQLEALEKARSYDEQTNISQNNDDLPFIINATALKEMA